MRILLENFGKSFGAFKVIEGMNLEIRDGEMLALLGPSGCGKSTTLFAICGIHKLTTGRVLFGDRDVSNIPSQQRNVGVVFQSFALYPHMTVAENIGFPLMVNRLPSAEIKRRVDEMAALVHIEKLTTRRPAELSGGQQQRVALARALVRKPDVLLLDEPLANLDAGLRLEMRSEIRRIQLETGITAILVTHDQVEAMSMCDRIAIMQSGKIKQIATPTEMYHNPASQFVAGFLGNPPIAFLQGTASGDAVKVNQSNVAVPLPKKIKALSTGAKVALGIRPEDYGPGGDVVIPGRVSFVETQGRENLYDVRLEDGTILRSIQPVRDDIAVGDLVNWGANGDRVMVFAEDGARL